MKSISILLAVSTVTLFAGCSTNRGGSVDQFDTTSTVEANPAPAGSPSIRPGLNPEDPRDPQFINPPQPGQPTKP